MAVLVFFLVFLLLCLGLSAYAAARLLAPMGWSKGTKRILFALALLHGALVPGLFVLSAYSGEWWADLLQWIGWLDAGLISIVIVLLFARDLLWLSLRLADRLHARLRGAEPRLGDPERRAFLGRALNAAALGLSGLLSALSVRQALRTAEVVRVRIPIPGLPEALRGFRIAQISDLHVGPTIREGDMRAVVEVVNGLSADLVAVTGDLVDGEVARLARHVAPLRDLSSRHGTFFITGNHEYYSGAAEWCRHCARELGWRVLLNQHETIEHEGARLLVAGVPDPEGRRYAPEHAPDLSRSLEGAPEVGLKVLLAHRPRGAAEAARAGFDLQLSGHTHGGQYFPFTLIIHLLLPFVAGLFQVGRMALYVNRGTTYWGPPYRLGSAQEITLVELVPARRARS